MGYALVLTAGMAMGIGISVWTLRPDATPSKVINPVKAESTKSGKKKGNKHSGKQSDEPTAKKVTPAVPALERVGVVPIDGAEIVAYDQVRKRVLVTGSAGVSVVQLAFDATPTLLNTIDVGSLAGLPKGISGTPTHVGVDPARRGFAAVTVVPSARARIPGALAFFSLDDGAPLGRVSVGFNPDALAFTLDGNQIVVANEGEPEIVREVVVDPPGSLSVVDLERVKSGTELAELSPADVTPIGFHGGVVGAALTRMASGELAPLRINPAARQTPDLDIEPESVAIDGTKAYVTLQENSGLCTLDLKTRSLTALRALPPVDRLMDASDKDGGIHIDDTMQCLPCPDQVARFSVGDKTYLAICEEGDDRGNAEDANPEPLADQVRLGWLASQNRLAPEFTKSHDLSESGLGRLRVCVFTGDTNSDGSLNHPVALGTRSMSVVDAESLTRVGDTGSQFEQRIAEQAASQFNANSKDPAKFDVQSDDRGPEPEGITIAQINGRPVAFVTLERPGGIAIVDLQSPAQPRVIDVVMTAQDGQTAPEGVTFVSTEDSPTGKPLLLVGFEGSGHLGIYRVNLDR